MFGGGTIPHSSAKHDTTVPKMTFDTYTGDNTANKAIAHGLGEVPKLIIIMQETAIAAVGIKKRAAALWCTNYNGTAYALTNTATDATNFYVGAVGANQYMNAAGETFSWVAIA